MRPDLYKPCPGQHFHNDKPHYSYRVCPWDKPRIRYTHVCYHSAPGFHYFGYRVNRLPRRAYSVTCYGVRYYCYNGVYYRYINGYYRVCRPPYYTALEMERMRQLELRSVSIRYYQEVNRMYSSMNSNNKYITEQNEIIAKNNSIIAQQQRIIAENENKIAMQNMILNAVPGKALTTNDNRFVAAKAYQTAQSAGLVQNFAASGVDYYYQDGVFYVIENNQYKVIVPPAGALVESLPEDYEIVTLGGEEYYKVDNTVYKVSNLDGTAYFEVVGQLE